MGRTVLRGFDDAHGQVSMIGAQAIAANTEPHPDGGVKSVDVMERSKSDENPARAKAVCAWFGRQGLMVT
ncbi:hypothetical protein [Roseobacter sp.]|uniref:hypothetical protein n=1 Tax=Roseobacter sp. TaxID=1907202 RepID=UPI0025F8872E|nr:hypothetical protein [Roseobacter sp.]